MRKRNKLHTCDDEAFIVFKSFSKEARDNEFRVDKEPDFFLDQSMSCDSTTYKPVCKVHLVKYKKKKKKRKKEGHLFGLKLEINIYLKKYRFLFGLLHDMTCTV